MKTLLLKSSLGKQGALPSDTIASTSDILLWYAKQKENVKVRHIFLEKGKGNSAHKGYDYLELEDGHKRRLTRKEKENLSLLPDNSKVFSSVSLESLGWSEEGSRPFNFSG